MKIKLPQTVFSALGMAALILAACQPEGNAKEAEGSKKGSVDNSPAARAGIPVPDESNIPESASQALFAGGCFWCVEECFQQKTGVIAVISGYAQGTEEEADYKKVCSGETGHTEAVQVFYDPSKVSFKELCEHFWKLHDPTTKDRQGNDWGPQYRSGIYYQNEEEKAIAEASKAALDKSGMYSKPAVTEILPHTTFFHAEDYHQNYYRLNPGDSYCRSVLVPKLKKLGLISIEDY